MQSFNIFKINQALKFQLISTLANIKSQDIYYGRYIYIYIYNLTITMEQKFKFLAMYLRAHNRRYDAVLETAPSTNSIVCISWCTKTSPNSNSSWSWESWLVSNWKESSVLWSGTYSWLWCLWRNKTVRTGGNKINGWNISRQGFSKQKLLLHVASS